MTPDQVDASGIARVLPGISHAMYLSSSCVGWGSDCEFVPEKAEKGVLLPSGKQRVEQSVVTRWVVCEITPSSNNCVRARPFNDNKLRVLIAMLAGAATTHPYQVQKQSDG